MKNISLLFILSLLVVSVTPTYAKDKLVIISDIDDTIKRSFVRDSMRELTNAFRVEKMAFFAMNELYAAILQANNGSRIHYVSNAVRTIMQKSHQKFLKVNNYPQGKLWLRDKFFEKDHKIRSIIKIIESEKPQYVILIGDNSQQDINFYNAIVKSYSDKKIIFKTYIKILYSQKIEKKILVLKNKQIGFITPIEIALNIMQQTGLLTLQDVTKLIKNYVASTTWKLNNDPYIIPSWSNCSDYVWDKKYPILDPAQVDIKKYVNFRCENGPK